MGIVERRKDNVPEMKPTPRSARMGAIADALMAARNWADKAKVPEAVPLVGGEGVGSLLLGKAPEELTEMSYGNMPMRVNPLAGRTASYVPEMKPGRKEQVADLAMLAGTPKVGKAGLGLAGGTDDVGRAAIAYHGTPHKFAPEPELPLGRFRAEKIGSGEGAQAYGYGTYFAEDPKVGKQYMTEVSSSMDARLLFPLRNQKGVLEAQLEADKVVRRGKNNLTAVERSEIYKQIKEIDKQLELLKPTITPSVYKVDIPDEMVGKMLDWDKPLKDQPKTVQEALKKLPQDIKEHIGIDKYNDLKGGPDIVKPLGGLIGDAKASEMLRQAGIPGIRYLDEVSRKKGEGTSNIVVFPGEESKVKILKRDGNETKMAKGGMMNRSIPGFQDGGNAVEPTTGNDVPIGSLPNEVADDIPARLSEGEFVLPADVVRFIGLERLMKLRDEAKEGLRRMAEVGQMGNAEDVGEKADESFEEEEGEEEEEDTEGFESDIDEIMSEVDSVEGQTEQAFAQGGAVGSQPWLSGFDMTKAPKNPVFDVRYYKHPDGRMMYVTFFDGKPMTPIPEGFTPTDKPTENLVGKEAEEKKKIPEGGGDTVGDSDVQTPAGLTVTPTGPDGKLQLSDLAKPTMVSPNAVKAVAAGLAFAGLPGSIALAKNSEKVAGFLSNKSGDFAGKANQEAMAREMGVDLNTTAGKLAVMHAIDDLSRELPMSVPGTTSLSDSGPRGLVGGAWGDMPDLSLNGPFDTTPAPAAPEQAPASAPPAAVPSPVIDYSSSVISGADTSAPEGWGGFDYGGYSFKKGGLVSKPTKASKPQKKPKGKGLASR